MSGWFTSQIVHTGRLPLFCFFVAFVTSFGFTRLSVRLIRAKVRWWFGNVTPGDLHVHHMVFGVVFMVVGGVAQLAAPIASVDWRGGSAAIFGLGTALVLDEFAVMLHLRDVYWTSAGRCPSTLFSSPPGSPRCCCSELPRWGCTTSPATCGCPVPGTRLPGSFS